MFTDLTVQGPDGETLDVPAILSMGMPSAKALGFDVTPVPSETQIGQTRDGQINVTELYSRGSTIDGFASVMIHEIGHTLGFTSSIPDDLEFGGGVTLTTLDLFRMAPGAGAARVSCANAFQATQRRLPRHSAGQRLSSRWPGFDRHG